MDVLFTFASAELVLMLVRAADIQCVLRSAKQRTPDEQVRIDRGLKRSLVVESVLLVPASAALLLLIRPLLMSDGFIAASSSPRAVYAAVGILSYGFPFATVRRAMTRAAMRTLAEFIELAPKELRDQGPQP